MKKIIFSVVITNYNYASYVQKSIESVLNQTFDKNSIEIIIVDDGSTDDSRKILSSYEQHPQCKVICQENKGQAAAINVGINNAQGKILSFLDSDDCFQENKLELIMNEFEKDTTLQIIKHKVCLIDQFEKVIFNDFPIYSTSTMSIRRKLFNDFDLIPNNLKISADTYFYMLECFVKWKMIPLPLSKYRVHSNNYFGKKFNELVKKDLPDYLLIQDYFLKRLTSQEINNNKMLQSRILEYQIYSEIFSKHRIQALKKLKKFNELHDFEPYLLFKNSLILLGVLCPWCLDFIRGLDSSFPRLSGYLRKIRGMILPKKWEKL